MVRLAEGVGRGGFAERVVVGVSVLVLVGALLKVREVHRTFVDARSRAAHFQLSGSASRGAIAAAESVDFTLIHGSGWSWVLGQQPALHCRGAEVVLLRRVCRCRWR